MHVHTLAATPMAWAETAARETPTPPRATRFGDMVGGAVVRSAESAMRSLPGGPMMALAVRGAVVPTNAGLPLGVAPRGASQAPEGPQPFGDFPIGSANLPNAAAVGLGRGAARDESAGIETAIARSQEMNLYFLEVQEAVNAQNRSYTALSNVLKAQHETVKTAIGNVR